MVRENLVFCHKRIDAAARRVGRETSGVVLVVVVKGVGSDAVKEAIDAGVRDVGENRVQEAQLRFDVLNEAARRRGATLTWHMIGHLQSNKVREAVGIFDLIHSVDSVRLAECIDKQAVKIGKVQDILLEVNVSEEASKYGLALDALARAARDISVFRNVRVKGLMTVAPFIDDPEQVRPCFHRLKELSQEIFGLRSSDFGLPILSMGMTHDFEVAVEEGATHVRIGRGIFGERSA